MIASNKELEELIYEFGHVMKCIGKCETDEKTSMKEYTKLISKKDQIIKDFDAYFKDR